MSTILKLKVTKHVGSVENRGNMFTAFSQNCQTREVHWKTLLIQLRYHFRYKVKHLIVVITPNQLNGKLRSARHTLEGTYFLFLTQGTIFWTFRMQFVKTPYILVYTIICMNLYICIFTDHWKITGKITVIIWIHNKFRLTQITV